MWNTPQNWRTHLAKFGHNTKAPNSVTTRCWPNSVWPNSATTVKLHLKFRLLIVKPSLDPSLPCPPPPFFHLHLLSLGCLFRGLSGVSPGCLCDVFRGVMVSPRCLRFFSPLLGLYDGIVAVFWRFWTTQNVRRGLLCWRPRAGPGGQSVCR